MIDIHLLRYALAAADSGSFSRAASRFGIKQSTLSRHVQYLEDRLGLPLFRRSTAGVTPTDSGKHFLSRARRIVDDVETLDADSRAFAAGTAGTLRLGFQSPLDAGNLAAVLRDFQAECPTVGIDAYEDDCARLLHRLECRRLDLAILPGRSQRSSLRAEAFWSEPVLIGLPAGHPLADVETLYWADLKQASFMVTATDPGPDLAAMITARLAGPGHRPTISSQHVSHANLGALAGNFLTVSAGPARPAASPGAPSFRQVHDAFGATVLEQYVHWRAEDLDPAARRFLGFIARRYGRTLPGAAG
ncbi:MAG TPA: LysR family transcriptional regulator [Sphingomonas sp.]|nr:LysR family transcriptional regulator [Sphingomonas sp.]